MTTIEITCHNVLTGTTTREHYSYRWRWVARLMSWHVNCSAASLEVWSARVLGDK